MLGLVNQQAGSYAPTSELEINRFGNLPFRELMWRLSTQVNGGILAAKINVFDLRMGKRRKFIPFLVYALVYLSIVSKLMKLTALSPWCNYV